MGDEQERPKLGIVGWIDLTVENADAVRDFYQAVAGWKAHALDMGGYSDYAMNPPGTDDAVAGICHARGKNTGLPAQWLIYINVENLDRSLEQVKAHGGAMVYGIRDMGSYGRMAVVRDPAGAVAGLFEHRR